MIARVWRGWARPEGAAAYARYFETALTPELRRIPGFSGAHLLRRQGDGDEVELVTITRFASMGAVRAFAGDAYQTAVVSEHARSLLTRFDATCRHYEIAATTGDEPVPPAR